MSSPRSPAPHSPPPPAPSSPRPRAVGRAAAACWAARRRRRPRFYVLDPLARAGRAAGRPPPRARDRAGQRPALSGAPRDGARASRENQLIFDEFDRWGEPLKDNFVHVLAPTSTGCSASIAWASIPGTAPRRWTTRCRSPSCASSPSPTATSCSSPLDDRRPTRHTSCAAAIRSHPARRARQRTDGGGDERDWPAALGRHRPALREVDATTNQRR